MNFFLIILLVFKTIKPENSVGSKYIDLLSEKEKENFLDNIARRILEEVQTKDDRPKASGELSDDQLNQHSEFVNQILKEESENLRKNANDTDAVKKEILSQDRKEDINNGDRYVDLTLRTDTNRNKRENNRRVFTGYSPDNDNNHGNENGEESDVDIQVKNFRRSKEHVEVININEEAETTTQTVDVAEDNETTKKSDDNAVETENITQDVLHIDNVPTTEKNTGTEETHAPLDSHWNSKENETEKNNLKTSAEVTKSAIMDSEGKENKKILKNDDTVEKTVIITSSEVSPNFSSRVARSYNDNSESDKKEYINLAINNETDSKVINIEVTLATENTKVTENELTSATENVSVTNANEVNTDTSNISEKTKTIVEILTTTSLPIEHSKSKNKNNEEFHKKISRTNEDIVQNVASNHNKKKANSKSLPKNSSNLANDVLFVVNNGKDKHINKIDAQYEKNKLKEYKVFEISPETSPFVKPKSPITQAKPTETIKEEPNHVPIYNFVPKNAFYNAHNLFGPNTDSDTENNSNAAVDDKAQDSSAFEIQEPFKKTKPVKKTQKEQAFYAPVYRFSPKNAFYNPYNYFGPNTEKEKAKGKDSRNAVDYDVESFNIDKYDGKDDIDDNEKNERLENEHHFESDKLRFRFGDNKSPKLSKGEPFKLNLPIAAPNLILNDIYINPNDYLDTDYYTGQMVRMRTRCERRQNDCEASESEESNENKSATEFQDKPLNIPTKSYKNSMAAIRQLLLENKYYGFIHPMTTPKPNIKKESEEEKKRHDTTEKETKEDTEEEEVKSDEVKSVKGQDKLIQFQPLAFNKGIDLRAKNKKEANEKTRNIAVDYDYSRSRNDIEFLKEEIERIYHLYRTNQEAHNSLDSSEVNIETRACSEEPTSTESDKNNRKNKTDYDLMKKIIDMAPDKDIMNILLQLENLNIKKVERSKEMNNDLNAYITVLGDMIKEKNKGLANYDWLGTTVELQSAIKKLIDMVEAVQNEEDLHPSDQELLRYIVRLHTSAKEELENGVMSKALRALLLPKIKKKKGYIKERGLIHRVWLIRAKEQETLIPDSELKDFEEFLDDLQTALFDLHTALKFIAMVTPYKNQKWLENLMQIHFESKRKQLLEIVLHMYTSRLLGLVEETAKNDVEDDYLAFVNKHEEEVGRTKEEFVFVLKLLEEIKNSN